MADLGSTIIKIVVAILGLVGIYYLYKYLTESTKTSAVIISGKQDATTLSISPVRAGNLTPLFMGGEFADSKASSIEIRLFIIKNKKAFCSTLFPKREKKLR